jgi:type II secretory pathway pseudopilin PulG
MRTARDEDGLTMVELVVTMGLLSIILGLGMTFVNLGTKNAADLEERNALQGQSRLVLEGIVRELRQATSGDAAVATIETSQPGTLTFLSPDRATPWHVRRISYRVNNNKLERKVDVSTDTDGVPWVIPATATYIPVLDAVRNTDPFSYRDTNSAATTTASAVRIVDIDLSIDPHPSQAPGPQHYKTTVEVRSI